MGFLELHTRKPAKVRYVQVRALSVLMVACAAALMACSNTTPKPPTNPPPGGTNFVVQALARVNAARSQTRNCGGTRYAAVPALSWDAKLEAAALAHTRDMIAKNFFSHTGSDGSNVGTRATSAGYTWSSIGENIAAGYPSLDAVVTGWLQSPGHCANLMSANFTQFGLSLQNASGNAAYDTYWTMVLARPK